MASAWLRIPHSKRHLTGRTGGNCTQTLKGCCSGGHWEELGKISRVVMLPTGGWHLNLLMEGREKACLGGNLPCLVHHPAALIKLYYSPINLHLSLMMGCEWGTSASLCDLRCAIIHVSICNLIGMVSIITPKHLMSVVFSHKCPVVMFNLPGIPLFYVILPGVMLLPTKSQLLILPHVPGRRQHGPPLINGTLQGNTWLERKGVKLGFSTKKRRLEAGICCDNSVCLLVLLCVGRVCVVQRQQRKQVCSQNEAVRGVTTKRPLSRRCLSSVQTSAYQCLNQAVLIFDAMPAAHSMPLEVPYQSWEELTLRYTTNM